MHELCDVNHALWRLPASIFLFGILFFSLGATIFGGSPEILNPSRAYYPYKRKKKKKVNFVIRITPHDAFPRRFFLFGFFYFLFFCNDFWWFSGKSQILPCLLRVVRGDSHLLPGSSRHNHDQTHSLPGNLHVQYSWSNYFQVPLTSTAMDSRCGTFTIAGILQSLTAIPRSFPMKGGCNDGSATNAHMSRWPTTDRRRRTTDRLYDCYI